MHPFTLFQVFSLIVPAITTKSWHIRPLLSFQNFLKWHLFYKWRNIWCFSYIMGLKCTDAYTTRNAWPFSPNMSGVSFDTRRWRLPCTVIFVCLCKNSSSFYWTIVSLGLVNLKYFVRHRILSLDSIMKMLLMSNWSTVRT